MLFWIYVESCFYEFWFFIGYDLNFEEVKFGWEVLCVYCFWCLLYFLLCWWWWSWRWFLLWIGWFLFLLMVFFVLWFWVVVWFLNFWMGRKVFSILRLIVFLVSFVMRVKWRFLREWLFGFFGRVGCCVLSFLSVWVILFV